MVITCRRCLKIAAVEVKTSPTAYCDWCRPLARLEQGRERARRQQARRMEAKDAQAVAALAADPRCSWAGAWALKRRAQGVDILK